MTGPTRLEEVDYPVSDGRPVAESDLHFEEMADYALGVLRAHFRPRAHEVYVAGNNFVYYRQGDRRAVVSPDVYLVPGVDQRPRDSFQVWREGGRRPTWVLEVTSKSTREEDLGAKMMRYRDDVQVPEYFLFDPRAEWIPERLRAFRLRAGVYRPLRARRGRILSRELGLELGIEAGHLRFYLPGEARPLPTVPERALAAEAALQDTRRELADTRGELAALHERVARLEELLCRRLEGEGGPGT